MKKLIAILLTLAMIATFAACGQEQPPVTTEGTEPVGTTAPVDTTAGTEEATEPAATVMSYAEFVAAELDTPVVVETYVQAVEGWWDGKVQLYTQNEEGAYYIYDLACTEEEAAAFVPGVKIRVSGFKGEWSGEVEILDGTYEILEGSYIVEEAIDVTELMGTDALAEKMNFLVSVKGLTVAASKDASGNDVPYLYKWDGSGSQGDDIYFNVTLGENTYTFTVNAYMLDNADTYTAVEALQIGDVIDVEGFLYWYNGAQPHITSVTVVE